MNVFLRRLIIALILGVLVYGVFAVVIGLETLGNALSTFTWMSFVGALGLASFNYCLRFLKWDFYLRRLGVRGIPVLENFLVFLSGFVLTVTPGKVGEVFKSAVLEKTHGIDPALTAPIVIAERLTDVIAVVLLIFIGSLGFSGGLLWAVLGCLAVAVGLLLILWDRPGDALFRRIGQSDGKLKALLPRLKTARASLQTVASPTALVVPTLLSLVGWAAEGLALYFLIAGFGQSVPLLPSVFFYATSTLAGALVPVPGGLGVAEAMLQSQIVQLGGVTPAAATGAMLLIRFATLWWAVLVGFISLFLLRLRFGKALF